MLGIASPDRPNLSLEGSEATEAISSKAAQAGNDGKDCFARTSIRFCRYLVMSEVRVKHFCQDAANLKNLTLCNQKHRLFLYLLGKCFAPTSVGRITREPNADKGNRLSSRDRDSGIVSRHGCGTSSQFPIPNALPYAKFKWNKYALTDSNLK